MLLRRPAQCTQRLAAGRGNDGYQVTGIQLAPANGRALDGPAVSRPGLAAKPLVLVTTAVNQVRQFIATKLHCSTAR